MEFLMIVALFVLGLGFLSALLPLLLWQHRKRPTLPRRHSLPKP
jgi:hypothetical protein